jgi:hypothetical protein
LPSARHARLRLGRRWHAAPHAWRSPSPPRPWRSPPPRSPLARRVPTLLLPVVSFARTATRWDPRFIRSRRCLLVQRRAQASSGACVHAHGNFCGVSWFSEEWHEFCDLCVRCNDRK